MRIGLLSDTHSFLDERVFHHFRDCDEVWHAGDFGNVAVLEKLQAFKPLKAVWGNIDGQSIRSACTEDLVWDCEGLRVYMTHIGGYPGKYAPRAKKVIATELPGLFITGHSHILKAMPCPAFGLLHLNPGACGHEGWHKVRTLMRFEVKDGLVKQLEVIELGKR